MENLEKSKYGLIKIVDLVLMLINAVIMVFIIAYGVLKTGNLSASVFAALMIAIFSINVIYIALTNRKFGYAIVLVTLILFIVNFAGNYLIGLSVFRNSSSVVAIIALALIPAITIAYLTLAVFGYIKIEKEPKPKYNIFRYISAAVLSLGLVALVIVGIVTFTSTSAINTNVVNLATIMIMLAVVIFAVIIKLLDLRVNKFKFKKTVACIMLTLTFVSITQFSIIEGVAYADDTINSSEFTRVFGAVDKAKLDNPRQRGYCYADNFFGVETKNYEVKNDVEFYVGKSQHNKNLSLKFDMYYPIYKSAHKSVLINLHGRGGDKDIGNYAHRNKYFASRGYVVFDIQYGDFNEKNTNVDSSVNNDKYFQGYVDQFFLYVLENNEVGADFKNTFLTGVSLGGGIVSGYAYTFEKVAALNENFEIKGIIPVYPGYSNKSSGTSNYLNYVTKESPPCLLVMSLSDTVVDVKVIDYTRQAYLDASNPNFACIGVTYAGHGSDSLLSGRFNQAYMYYTERFMASQRS